MGFDIPIPVLIFGVIAALVVVGMAVNAYVERKRREEVQRVADELGLDFLQDGDPDLVYELPSLPLFSKGRSKRISNMIRGETEEVVMGIFDYRYTTGSGKNSHTYHQSVAFFRSDDLNLPLFDMRPQSFFHGIGKMFGYQDIDFESHPRFSKHYLLRGSSEQQVRATFRPEVLTALEEEQSICLEGCGHDLVVYREATRAKPQQLKQLMNDGFRIFSLFRRRQ